VGGRGSGAWAGIRGEALPRQGFLVLFCLKKNKENN